MQLNRTEYKFALAAERSPPVASSQPSADRSTHTPSTAPPQRTPQSDRYDSSCANALPMQRVKLVAALRQRQLEPAPVTLPVGPAPVRNGGVRRAMGPETRFQDNAILKRFQNPFTNKPYKP
eukprot:TRINITY_DN8663_c0_g1_i1.p1 TRINITY_DN8663_c0_g1~~TRINITY_DN8663_c0_g1_i1.p1  ORF type:complete len:130 (-),score=13.12 TRINITY_DN8663_c0_g1_i1:16-381(-)